MNKQTEVRVWDSLVRIFHWGLASAFVVAFVTEDDFLDLHVLAGYTVLIIVSVRILWGFIGTRFARFSSFVFAPRVIFQYLKDRLLMRGRRYIGHNPAGGAMIVLMLLSLLTTTLSGLVLYGAEERAGPLMGYLINAGDQFGDLFENLHELSANLTLILVLIHIGGVLVESILHRENLIRSMWTGIKRKHLQRKGVNL